MKNLWMFIVLLLLSHWLGAQDEFLYSAKSGKIVYEYELGSTKSVYSFLFDQHGKRQVIDIVNNDISTDHVKTVITPKYMLVVNYEDKQVLKIPMDAEDTGMETGAGFNLSQLVAEITTQDLPASGNEMVSGKSCKVYSFNDRDGNKGKYWVWNGYLMKADFVGEDGEHAFMQVKEINLDIAIDEAEFAYPKNFEINDMTQMMEQMKQLQQMYGVPDDE